MRDDGTVQIYQRLLMNVLLSGRKQTTMQSIKMRRGDEASEQADGFQLSCLLLLTVNSDRGDD